MKTSLNTSAPVTADSPKGQRATETFRAQYNKAELNEESAQILNEHPGFAAYLLTGIRRFSTKAPDYTLARTILGKDFISPEEVIMSRAITYTDEQLAKFGNALPSEELLLWCRDKGYVLVAGPNKPMSLLEVREVKRDYFYSREGGWYTNDSEKFSRNDKADSAWIALLKKEVEGSRNEKWNNQNAHVLSPVFVPNAGEFSWVVTTFKAVRNINLFPDVYVRTSSLNSSRCHVDFGRFDAQRLHIGHWNDDNPHFYVGVSAARKWPLKS